MIEVLIEVLSRVHTPLLQFSYSERSVLKYTYSRPNVYHVEYLKINLGNCSLTKTRQIMKDSND